MKPKLAIVCIEDEAEVLESVLRDLEIFEDHFRIEAAQSVPEAEKLVELLIKDDCIPALFICDHLMPGITGVEFMVGLSKIPETDRAGRMLLTGQAGLPDTVKAVNEAGLDYYLAKPWKTAQLQEVVKDLLTRYVGLYESNPLPYMAVLDPEKLSDAMRDRKTLTDM
jgi:response regulator RpfG family c-di-GMP phosphodiesterase